jgi:cation:H+ antiporter
MIKDIEELTSEAARSSAWQSLWTFPSMILAALVIAWGAESAQFLVSQAFALTILALIQTLPEFAVEGFIAWNAGQHPTVTNIGLMTANFTGALRLLIGLGWPLIFVTTVIFNLKKSHKISIAGINLDHEHAVEITGLFVGSVYSIIIVVKGTLNLIDTVILFLLYAIYITFLLRLPARDEERLSELEVVPRFILTRRRWLRNLLIWACFVTGGTGILLVADPFLESALGLSVVLGVPAFMLIQWLAPFLSEFPEKISAFYWAKSIVKAPMALMNMVSSGIAECTLLIGVIPIVFCISLGSIDTINFDWPHRAEILLTATQGILGVIILSKMSFRWFEALGLFITWATQIYFQYDVSQISFPLVADVSIHAGIWNLLHIEILKCYTILYWIWIAIEFFLILVIFRKLPALGALRITWNSRTR